MNAKTHVNDVAAAYDAWSAVYDVDGNPLVALDDVIVPRLYDGAAGASVPSTPRALDVGCGTGRHCAHLLERGFDVVGVDGSAGMLARARERFGRRAPTFVHHDLARGLPFDDASFDVVVCALVLEHVLDLRAPLREFARVCKKGGIVVVSDIHARMRELTQANFTDPATGDDVLPPSFPHEAQHYVDAARDAGLVVERLVEERGTDAFAARVPRARKYVGVPMLVAVAGRK